MPEYKLFKSSKFELNPFGLPAVNVLIDGSLIIYVISIEPDAVTETINIYYGIKHVRR